MLSGKIIEIKEFGRRNWRPRQVSVCVHAWKRAMCAREYVAFVHLSDILHLAACLVFALTSNLVACLVIFTELIN